MKPMPLGELKRRAKDRFSYILLGCPNWGPLLKNVTIASAFGKQIEMLSAILDRTKEDDAKQWLRLCINETRESRRAYETGDLPKEKS